jgi:hypothetical protein
MLGITMPLKNLPNDWTPIFKAVADISTPLRYRVGKFSVFKPKAIEAPLLGGIIPARKPPER